MCGFSKSLLIISRKRDLQQSSELETRAYGNEIEDSLKCVILWLFHALNWYDLLMVQVVTIKAGESTDIMLKWQAIEPKMSDYNDSVTIALSSIVILLQVVSPNTYI